MTPLLLFLLLSAAIYLGTVTAAFSALMSRATRTNTSTRMTSSYQRPAE